MWSLESLTVVCAEGPGDLFSFCCISQFVILTLLPPAKHSDTTNIYQMNNNKAEIISYTLKFGILFKLIHTALFLWVQLRLIC